MPYPRFQRARNFKALTHTAGDFAVTSSTFDGLSSGLTIALAAQVGDVIEFSVNGMWGNGSPIGELDAQFTNSGRRFSGASRGYGGWSGQPSVYGVIGGSVFSTVQAADVVNGLVTVWPVAKQQGGTKTLYGTDAAYPFYVFARNLGPADTT